tara:strand:+ start:853 stop:987 length:135 start_codon:yes stop_codon:yes gene_type:complete
MINIMPGVNIDDCRKKQSSLGPKKVKQLICEFAAGEYLERRSAG